MPLSDLFKSKKELEQEAAKQQKRELRQATRSCDRTSEDLARQEKELETQIKRAASKGDSAMAKTLAKQLIRVRNEKVRALGVKSKISTISSHSASMQANQKLAGAIASASTAVAASNAALRPEQMAQTIQQFQAESTKMEMKDEALEDMFDDIFNDSEEEAEGDAVMREVLDEIGVDLSNKLRTAPTPARDSPIKNPGAKNAGTVVADTADDELTKKLDRLKHM